MCPPIKLAWKAKNISFDFILPLTTSLSVNIRIASDLFLTCFVEQLNQTFVLIKSNPENLQFKLQAFDVPQIKKVFGKFKTSKGFGPDGIANHFLKIAFSVIAESLCDIFNLSIATGVFPENWKTARFAPIFKSGEKNNRSNYRPISVLPFLARLFEKIDLQPTI